MKRYLPILALFYCHQLYAMLCPGNFNTINIGDPVAKVTALCGKPDQENKSTSKPDSDLITQEWIYLLKPDPSADNGMRVSIVFKNKKATSIAVNGAGLGTTTLCSDTTINTGDSMETIKKACGTPMMVNKSSSDQQPKEVEIIEFKYTNLPVPASLIFEDGKLKERKG